MGDFLHIMLMIPIFFLAFGAPLPEPESNAQKIDTLMSAYHAYHQFNGSILVAKHGKVIFKKGFGFADVEREIPNAPNTRFRLASVTKQFTAVLVLKLAERGALELDDTISDHLPYYREDTGKRVTIHHLLSHTSGIPSYGRDKAFMRKRANQAVEVAPFVKERCSDNLEFEPGTSFKYSNSGYYILGAIIEAVTGLGYGDAVQQHIFTPLHMEDSGYDSGSSKAIRRAIGYRQYGPELEPANTVDVSVAFAAGGLYSTVEDLFKWDRALYFGNLLPKELLTKMISPNLGHYGYGVRIGSVLLPTHGPKRLVAHGGGIFGFSHYLIHFLDDDHLIAILCNGGERPNQAEQNILKILNELPYAMPKPSVADAILPLVRDGKTGEALSRAQELRSDDRYVLDADEFNRAGYALLDEGEESYAIDLFTLNTRLFPQYGRAFEGLGKAYLASQNLPLAIETFKKAYALDPHCDDAKRFLNLMGVDVAQHTPSAMSLTREVIERYVGEYQMSPQRTLRFYFDGDRFMAQPSGQRPVQLLAESETRFQVQNASAKIDFLLDDQGKAVRVSLTQRGREMTGKRID